MNPQDVLETLASRGIHCWTDGTQLLARGPVEQLDEDMRASLSVNREEILRMLKGGFRGGPRDPEADTDSWHEAIGASIGGSGTPIIDPARMANRLRVTMRPPPQDSSPLMATFSSDLARMLADLGVEIVPWTSAFTNEADPTTESAARQGSRGTIRADIDAVFDVERAPSAWRTVRTTLADAHYRLRAGSTADMPSITSALRAGAWLDDDLVVQLEDPARTQIVLLRELASDEWSSELSYAEKIDRGLKTLFGSFSQIALSVDRERAAIINLNLCDTVIPRVTLHEHLKRTLIPKLYVPIRPIPLSRFRMGRYDPQSPYVSALTALGRSLAPTGLFPSGSSLAQLIRRRSRRDMFSILADGRAGVSYGFVAVIEPPRWSGDPRELDRAAWEALEPVEGQSPEAVRQNANGRRYLGVGAARERRYLQIPDLWLLSSRSGADKTGLEASDVVRVGLERGDLHFQIAGNASEMKNVRPSYDLYVMFGMALATALCEPRLLEKGAALIHFHGYPSPDWFTGTDCFAGTLNPSMPCGTFESGVLGFLGVVEALKDRQSVPKLITVIEPDHGVNMLSPDPEWLVERLINGAQSGQVELGGRHFQALRHAAMDGH